MIVVLEPSTANNRLVKTNSKFIYVNDMEDALQAVKNLRPEYIVVSTQQKALPLLMNRLHKLKQRVGIMLIEPGQDHFMLIDKNLNNSINHHIKINS